MKYAIFQDTRAGKRPYNEDRLGCWQREGSLLLAVADGMGGHAHGEVAAQIAVDQLGQAFAAEARPKLAAPDQVWSNLVGNALKYSRGANPPCIDIGWDASRRAYYVRDNGVGFDMAYAGKLFGVFERLHAESEFEGRGIGLAIAERIVRLHGGAIWADAAPGRGAIFWFTVPASGSGA